MVSRRFAATVLFIGCAYPRLTAGLRPAASGPGAAEETEEEAPASMNRNVILQLTCHTVEVASS